MSALIDGSYKYMVCRYCGFVLTVLQLCWQPPASADEYHYNNILIGDRSSGMGGAYTAISEDPSGLYYNPAGIVYASGNNLSGSMNSYHNTSTTYKDVLGGNQDWERKSSSILPNFFGIIQAFGNGKAGFSYAVTDDTLEDQDQTFSNILTSLGVADTFKINFNNQDTTFLLGPSYARKVRDDLSLGITLYGYFREQERILNLLLTYPSSDYDWTNQYLHIKEFGLTPVLGLMWSPFDKVSLGMSVRKTVLLDSKTTLQNICRGAVGATCSSATVTESTVTSEDKLSYPLNVTFGAAYFANSALLVSGDFSYYFDAGSGLTEKVETWNGAAGVEYYLDTDWALRGGLFTNHANTPSLKNGITSYNQPEHIDLYGGSVSISHFNNSSSITLGASLSMGEGKAQLISNTATLQDTEMLISTIFMSASYSY